jgi:hypothetical protein
MIERQLISCHPHHNRNDESDNTERDRTEDLAEAKAFADGPNRPPYATTLSSHEGLRECGAISQFLDLSNVTYPARIGERFHNYRLRC